MPGDRGIDSIPDRFWDDTNQSSDKPERTSEGFTYGRQRTGVRHENPVLDDDYGIDALDWSTVLLQYPIRMMRSELGEPQSVIAVPARDELHPARAETAISIE